MQRDPHTILLRPILSEKTVTLCEDGTRAVFEVAVDANKVEVAKAVETVFEVKVARVNTQRVPGKVKRMGKFSGRRRERKRAVVTLRPGHTLNLFES